MTFDEYLNHKHKHVGKCEGCDKWFNQMIPLKQDLESSQVAGTADAMDYMKRSLDFVYKSARGEA